MGLLDDAIREHMELKRLRGADPAVIAQQEHDALGPVMREEEREEDVAAPHAGDAAAPHAQDDVSTRGGLAPVDDPLPRDHGALHDENDALPVGDSSEPQQSGHDHADHHLDFANVGQETAELDMRTVLDEQHETADRAGQIDSAGLAVAPDESGEPAEDVLEETPDFLRDTPEQERLWFEQQPPRDFDFDK